MTFGVDAYMQLWTFQRSPMSASTHELFMYKCKPIQQGLNVFVLTLRLKMLFCNCLLEMGAAVYPT